MRILLIIGYLFSFSSFACIPCDKETVVIVLTQATPNFASSFSTQESIGQVRFIADVNIKNELENIQIISTTPNDLNQQVMMDMIKRSSYRLHTHKEKHVPCLVKGYEFVFNFNVPQNVKLELDIDF